MKNVLLINNSERPKGNGETILRICEKLLSKDEYLIDYFSVKDMNILDCTGCLSCSTQKQPCHLDDDFNKLIKLMINADIIILCAPVYIFGTCSNVKKLSDRLLSAQGCVNINKKKSAGVIITASKKDWEGSSVREACNLLLAMGSEVKDYLLCYTYGPFGVLKDENLVDKLKNFLENIIDDSKKPQEYPNECPTCFGNTFKIIGKDKVTCPSCDITASISQNDKGETLLLFDDKDYKNSRISSHRLIEHRNNWIGQSISKDYIKSILKKRKELLG